MSLAAYTAKTWTDYADSPDLSAANVQYMDSGIAAVTAEVIALELALPTTYQPISAELSALAGLSSTGYAKRTGAGAWSVVASIPQADVSGLNAALAGLQPLDSDLTAIAALTTTSYGRGFLPLADAAAALSYIGAQPAGSYQPLDSDLTAIAAISTQTFGRSLLTAVDAAAGRALLGAQVAGSYALSSDLANYLPLSGGTMSGNLLGSTSYNIGAATNWWGSGFFTQVNVQNNPVWHAGNLAFGTGNADMARGDHAHAALYQPLDSDLTSIANLATTGFARRTGANTWSASAMAWADISGIISYGTAAGTVCQGNDSRVINGQTAYSWGDHRSAGYASASSLANYLPLTAGSSKPLTGALYGTAMVMSTGGTAPSVGLYAWPAVPASRTFIGLTSQDGTTGSWAGTTGLVLWADSAVLSGVVTAGINAGGVTVLSATSSLITLAATLNGTSAAFSSRCTQAGSTIWDAGNLTWGGNGSAGTMARSDHNHSGVYQPAGSYEAALGNPGTSGYLFSSTTAGVRSWVAPYTHPATHPQSVVDSSFGWITTALAGKQAAGNYVTTDTAQTISGIKTFSETPVLNAGMIVYTGTRTMYMLISSESVLFRDSEYATVIAGIDLLNSRVYINKLSVAGVSSHFAPTLSGLYDIGYSGNYWNNAYINYVNAISANVQRINFTSIVNISSNTALPIVAPGEVVMLVGASTGSVTNNPVTNAWQTCKYRTSSGAQASAAAGGATVNLDLYGSVAFLVGRTTRSATLLS